MIETKFNQKSIEALYQTYLDGYIGTKCNKCKEKIPSTKRTIFKAWLNENLFNTQF